MSGTHLGRIRSKITRAKQHIQDLQLGLAAFYDTNPYSVRFEDNHETGKRTYYVVKADCVPDNLAAIAADILQNLRSPLDHIAYHLVLHARSGTEPNWKVYFPIAGSAAYYPARRKGTIKGVGQPVIDAIDATEPYKGGKGHALWQLNELNNPDKHRTPLLVGGFYFGVDISNDFTYSLKQGPFGTDPALIELVRKKCQQFVIRPADSLMGMKVGDALYAGPIEHDVDQQRSFVFDVAFNAPGVIDGEPVLVTVQNMANLVDDLVTALGRFLP